MNQEQAVTFFLPAGNCTGDSTVCIIGEADGAEITFDKTVFRFAVVAVVRGRDFDPVGDAPIETEQVGKYVVTVAIRASEFQRKVGLLLIYPSVLVKECNMPDRLAAYGIPQIRVYGKFRELPRAGRGEAQYQRPVFRRVSPDDFHL